MNWVLIVGVFVCATFCEKSASEEPLLPAGITCLPGSEWNNRCNHCKCLENGTSSCTNLTCTDKLNEPDLDCAPETVWKYECNVCACSPYGRMICTRMACNRKPVLDFNPVGPKKPEPVAILETELRMSIPVDAKEKIVCPANKMFIKDCNTCQCNEDGTFYVCTRKICIENKKTQEKFIFPSTRRKRATAQATTKNCQPGQEFRLDCNQCLCDNDGREYSCTRNDCNAPSNYNSGPRNKREVTPNMELECEPTKVFMQDCNVCKCSEDGKHATCTTKRCKEDKTNNDVKKSESDFRCNPGEQFKRDCNDCACSADGKSEFCTLRICGQDLIPTI